jgi:hypothetical protein
MIQPINESQIDPVGTMFARAFHNDPLYEYVFPKPERRKLVSPGIHEMAVRYGYRYGKVYATPGLEGASVWLPPDATSLSARKMVLSGMWEGPPHVDPGRNIPDVENRPGG